MSDAPGTIDVFMQAVKRRRTIVPLGEGRGEGGADVDMIHRQMGMRVRVRVRTSWEKGIAWEGLR
jgi:hypothetical protein